MATTKAREDIKNDLKTLKEDLKTGAREETQRLKEKAAAAEARLREQGDEQTLISTINRDQAEELIKKGVISGGMIPKVESCLAALQFGVNKGHIIDGRIRHSLLLEIFTPKGIGTEILKNG